MTAVAGEVADGFLVHPVNSRRSLLELTAARDRGRRAPGGGRDASDIELVCVTIVVTGRDEQEMERSREAVRAQLAFYGTTPAYLPVFELHGYGDLHPELKRMARDDRWPEMADLIDDDLIETIAVVGEPHEIAPQDRGAARRHLRVGQPREQPGARTPVTSPRSSPTSTPEGTAPGVCAAGR